MIINLSPYEKDRIIPEDLGQTVLGQDMLAQDYILKQLTASLIYPEKNLGRNFWDKIYADARQMYGTTQIPVNTFNKVWILPEYAKVFEHKNTVLVVKSHLKVMLDEDYLSLQKHSANSPSLVKSNSPLFYKEGLGEFRGSSKNVNNLGSQIIRQIILPAIEQEVNQGQNFAQLRQIYNSMILAVWFKTNLKQALLNQVYTDKSKVNGVNVDDPAIKEKIYQQYLQAYKKGVFNYIKEDIDQNTQETIPRKYFSGGIGTVIPAMLSTSTESQAMNAIRVEEGLGTIFVEHGSTEANRYPATNPTAAMISRVIEVKHPVLFTDRLNTLIQKDDFFVRLATTVSLATGKILKVKITPDGEEEIDDGVTYTQDGHGGVQVNFDDGTYFNYTIGTDSQVTVTAADETVINLIRDTLKQFAFEDTRLSDYGYDHRVGLGSILATIDSNHVEITEDYNNSVRQIESFLRLNMGQNIPSNIPVYLVQSNRETFGIAVIHGGLYIEQPFINRMNSLGNPFGMFRRSLVYALAQGTHYNKRVAEYEWARHFFGDKFLKNQLRTNVVNVFEFYKESFSGKKDQRMVNEILTRGKQSLWEIGVHLMNGDIHKPGEVYVRYKKTDRLYDPTRASDMTPAKVGFYGLAAGPLHAGQLDYMLREMADFKIDQEGYRTHAYDLRKELTVATNSDRQLMMAENIEDFFPGFFFNCDLGAESELPAEAQVPEFIDGYNGDRPGPLTTVYSIAEDHGHWDAPDNKTRDRSGQRKPIIKNGQIQPDTFRRLFVIRQQDEANWDRKGKKILTVVNGRDPRDGVLMKASGDYPGEVDKVKELEAQGFFVRTSQANLKGTSSSAIRNSFGLSDNPTADIAYLPNQIGEWITGPKGGTYRGLIIGLGDAIGKVVAGSADTKPITIIRNWIKFEIKNGNLPSRFEEMGPDQFNSIASRFSFTTEMLVKTDKVAEARLRVELAQILGEKAAKGAKLILTPEEVQKAFQIAWPKNQNETSVSSFSAAMTSAEAREIVESASVLEVPQSHNQSLWRLALFYKNPENPQDKTFETVNEFRVLIRNSRVTIIEEGDVYAVSLGPHWQQKDAIKEADRIKKLLLSAISVPASPAMTAMEKTSLLEQIKNIRKTFGQIVTGINGHSALFGQADIIQFRNAVGQFKSFREGNNLNVLLNRFSNPNGLIFLPLPGLDFERLLDRLENEIRKLPVTNAAIAAASPAMTAKTHEFDLKTGDKIGDTVIKDASRMDALIARLGSRLPNPVRPQIGTKTAEAFWVKPDGSREAIDLNPQPLRNVKIDEVVPNQNVSQLGKAHAVLAEEVINKINPRYHYLINDSVLTTAKIMIVQYGGFSYRYNPGIPNDARPFLEIGKPGDFAMFNSTSSVAKRSTVEGGIDLNPRNLKMESEGQKVNITFNAAMMAQFRRGDFSGVMIKILDVEPVNLMPLLGFREDEGSEKLAKS